MFVEGNRGLRDRHIRQSPEVLLGYRDAAYKARKRRAYPDTARGTIVDTTSVQTKKKSEDQRREPEKITTKGGH